MNFLLDSASAIEAIPDRISLVASQGACIGSAQRIIDAGAIYIASKSGLTMKLDGKVAIVTGSARGLGWEIIQAFAQEGAKVAICDLTQSDVDDAVARWDWRRRIFWALKPM